MYSEHFGEHGYVHVARYATLRRQLRVWEFDILRWAFRIDFESLLDLGDVGLQALSDFRVGGSLKLLLFSFHCMVQSTPLAFEIIDMLDLQHAVEAGVQ